MGIYYSYMGSVQSVRKSNHKYLGKDEGDDVRVSATLRWMVVIVLLLLSVACGRDVNDEPSGQGTLSVTVSIVPQVYFVERVGGAHVSVQPMVLPGSNPATYEPKPEQLKALSQADAYMSIGVPFEGAWLDKIAAANSQMAMVDTAVGIERVDIAHHLHDAENGHEGESGNLDPHIWLSPRLVKVQARNIGDALIDLDPQHSEDYERNLATFLEDLDELDRYIETRLDDLEQRKFMVFHPSWGYFADDYDLEMIPIEVSGQEPSPKELAALIEQAKQEDIHVIFAQPEFSTRQAETIADEINGRVLLIAPLAADWLENMRSVADAFADVLGEDAS